jgi:hypothetical protein
VALALYLTRHHTKAATATIVFFQRLLQLQAVAAVLVQLAQEIQLELLVVLVVVLVVILLRQAVVLAQQIKVTLEEILAAVEAI